MELKEINLKAEWKRFCLILLAFLILQSCFFTMRQTESAATLFMGKPFREIEKAGPYFKIPWPLEVVKKYDHRKRIFDSAPDLIFTKEQKPLMVDAFHVYRVPGPFAFLQKYRWDFSAVERTIDDFSLKACRNTFGLYSFAEVVVTNRDTVESNINRKVTAAMAEVKIIQDDFGINRINLPEANLKSAYDRMKQQRTQVAEKYKSEGAEIKNTTIGRANREVSFIESRADSAVKSIYGYRDARVGQIYNSIMTLDPRFFKLLYAKESAEKALMENSDVTFLVDTRTGFMKEIFQPVTK